VALLSTHGGALGDYGILNGGLEKIGPVAPMLAVPTTAGTGAEVGRAATLTLRSGEKTACVSPHLISKAVICDPELTYELPRSITAATGMDALAHCFEAFCAPGYHPMADGIALEGMRLVHDWLPAAVSDGTNIEARANMMAAAAMGATAFQKGLGAIHALSHPVGAVYDTHHGLTNAVFFPYVMEFNRDAIADKMVRLARTVGLDNPSYDSVLAWVLDLRKKFDIPSTAAQLGVEESRLDELSEMAADDPTAGGNPVKAGAAEMKAMYQAAMGEDAH